MALSESCAEDQSADLSVIQCFCPAYQGLLSNELLAIDGCKQSFNAAKEHFGRLFEHGSLSKYETLSEKEQKRDKLRKKTRFCLNEHKKLDGRKPNERERKKQLDKASKTLERSPVQPTALFRSA